jgi:hypothetical protein
MIQRHAYILQQLELTVWTDKYVELKYINIGPRTQGGSLRVPSNQKPRERIIETKRRTEELALCQNKIAYESGHLVFYYQGMCNPWK